MPYVRQRGNQVAIVHGVRHPESGRVEQQVLFTLYSRQEADLALGRPRRATASDFERLLQERYPSLRFDWPVLRSAIDALLLSLPESYDDRPKRLRARFRTGLVGLVRQLVETDPQYRPTARKILGEHRLELEYLRELIAMRQALPETPATQDTAQEFFWSLASDHEIPPEIEEHAAEYYERRDYDRARAAFTLLTESFEDYAEGHNYLGLIALDQCRLDDAILHFQKTMELGRKLFPSRIARKSWWLDLRTRPYMRGLRNLALATLQAGRSDEVLVLCDRLEKECFDEATAAAYRANGMLNKGLWAEARQQALLVRNTSPQLSLVASLAAYELESLDDARSDFVHAMLNAPRTVASVLGVPYLGVPQGLEIDEHEGGIAARRSLVTYLASWSPAARAFFRKLWDHEQLRRLRAELVEVTERWRTLRSGTDRRDYDRAMQLRSPEFAHSVFAQAGKPTTPTPPKGVPRRRR